MRGYEIATIGYLGDCQCTQPMGTVLGSHTIDEVEHLVATVDYRIAESEKLFRTLNQPAPELDFDWAAFKTRWENAKKSILPRLAIQKAAAPLVPNYYLPAESEYAAIRKAINVGGQDTYQTGDLMDLILRIEKASGKQIDESRAPQPTGWDPDHGAFQKVDKIVRSGEGAAKDFASDSTVRWIVIGGVALAALYLFGPALMRARR